MSRDTIRSSVTISAGEPVLCNMCASAQRKLRFRSYRGTVYECDSCGVFYVDDQNTTASNQEKLFYSTIDEKSYRAYFEPFRSGQYRRMLQKLRVAKGSALLDVGASYGWMLRVALSLGFDSYGLEPGDAQCETDLQNRIYRASLEEYCSTANRRFDVITIWHVLEHLRDPSTALAQMRGLLRDDGVLLVAVPTSEGWLFKLALLVNRLFCSQALLNELFYFHNPNMHFFYPNVKSLRILLERSGFVIESTALLEAFDWVTIYVRGNSSFSRLLLKFGGPLIKWSRLTASENLVMVARKQQRAL